MATYTGTSGDDTYTGTALGDQIDGVEGNDTLDGADGGDRIYGGLGSDVLHGGAGRDELFANRADLSSQRETDDLAVDTLNGGDGNDVLSASFGDNLDGGEGYDQFRLLATSAITVHFTGDPLMVAGGLLQGFEGLRIDGSDFDDTITFAPSWTGMSTVYGFDGNDILRGGAGLDRLYGGSGQDTLDGGGGNDILVAEAGENVDGGAGDDKLNYQLGGGTSGVIADFSDLWATGSVVVGGGLLQGIEHIGLLSASPFDDTITLGDMPYSEDSTVIHGFDGNDTLRSGGTSSISLYGGAGDDAIYGADGDEQLSGADGADVLSGGGGADDLSGQAGNDRLGGGAGNDHLEGGDGNDRMQGGNGADIMAGGAGNDEYFVDNAGDRVEEGINAGTDTVNSSVGFRLNGPGGWPRHVDNLVLTGTADINGTGNDLANTVSGNDGANGLHGMLGDDALLGGAGNDLLIGDAGSDTLTGGTGRDLFRFADLADMQAVQAAADSVTDFDQAENDRIQLNLIDADTTTAGTDDAFAFVGTAAFGGNAGELRYEQVGGDTFVAGDVDGDALADFFIRLDGLVAVAAEDFFL